MMLNFNINVISYHAIFIFSWRKVVESNAELYVDKTACVRVGMDVSE